MENEITIKDLIQEANDWIEDFTKEDGSIDQKRKEEIVGYMEDNIHDGSTGPVEGLILLSLIDGLEGACLDTELIYINSQSYPQFKTVQRAMSRRMENVPMCALLDSFVIDDFLRSYGKKSITFDELVYRLAMLGRMPRSDYLRMSPKERRALGTNVDLYHVW